MEGEPERESVCVWGGRGTSFRLASAAALAAAISFSAFSTVTCIAETDSLNELTSSLTPYLIKYMIILEY